MESAGRERNRISIQANDLKAKLEELAIKEKRSLSSLARALLERALEWWDLFPNHTIKTKLEKLAEEEKISFSSFLPIFLETSTELWDVSPSLSTLTKFKALATLVGRNPKILMEEALQEKMENLLLQMSPSSSIIPHNKQATTGQSIADLLVNEDLEDVAKRAALPLDKIKHIALNKSVSLSADELINLGRALKKDPAYLLKLQNNCI